MPQSRKESCQAAASLRLTVGAEKTRVALTGLLADSGLPNKLIGELVGRYGVAAPDIVRGDPFRLLFDEMSGCGFKRIDALHHSLGKPHDDPRRLSASAWNRVGENPDGHTWVSESRVMQSLAGDVGDDAQAAGAISSACDAGLLRRVRDAGGAFWLSLPARADAEKRIAESVDRLLKDAPTLWPDATSLPAVTDHQRDRLRDILTQKVAVLTGTPGTGKTFTAAQVIKAVSATRGVRLYVCAPTGKAAVRITKAMQEYDLDLEATTIHRLLEVEMGPSGFRFKHNRKNPLACDVVVLDESSMVDVDLMAFLLDALPDDGHLLIIGDPYQLPPVGHGAPLRDLIGSGRLPPGELTEIHRNSGLIVAACRDIKDGNRYKTGDAFDEAEKKNFRHVEVSGAEAVVRTVRDLCRRIKERCVEPGFCPRPFDPIEDLQVLTAVNDKTLVSRAALNAMLQAEMNPGGQGGDAHVFRVGDKVIGLKNGKHPVCDITPGSPTDCFDAWFRTSDAVKERYVANGDMGRVLAVSPTAIVVRFNHPERIVLVNLPVGRPAEGKDGEPAGPPTAGAGIIDLGYAITAHKSQGSEWPFVVLPIDDSDQARRVACREWLYTAISRAKWRCLLVGRREVADGWCQTVVMKHRKTFLKERLARAAPPKVVHGDPDLRVAA